MNIIYIYIYTYTNLLCVFFWFHDVAQCQARTLAKRILYSTHWGVFFISPGQCRAMPLFVDICNLFQNPKPTWLYCFVLVMLCVSLCLWHCPGVSPMESLAKRDTTRDAKANWPCKTCSCGNWGGGSVSFCSVVFRC